jgi:RNA polymerase sigma factor (sigma-70 family)
MVTNDFMSQAQAEITAWMDEAGRMPLLPKEEILVITRQIQDEDTKPAERRKLVNKIVMHNLRLVVSFVHPFMDAKSCHKWGSPETLDYLQTGVFGLVRAAEKYDPERGYAFSTYATHWIRSFVGRYNMRASSPFKISEEACRAMYSYERHGKMTAAAKVGRAWKEDPEQACQLVKAAQSPVSLYLQTDKGSMLLDIISIEQPESIAFYEDSFSPELEQIISKAELTADEDTFVRATFLSGYKRNDFCDLHGVSSREYGRLRSKAFKKLKSVADPAILSM